MNNAKLNLYNAEWLDLVFDHRNKAYGAYELRQHYGRTMNKAMVFTFAGLAVLIVASIVFRHKVVPADGRIIYDIPVPKLIEPPAKDEVKKNQLPKTVAPSKPSPPVTTVRFVTPVVTTLEKSEEPPTLAELKDAAVGPKTSKADGGDLQNIDPIDDPGKGIEGKSIVEDNTPLDFRSIEAMPVPDGGAAGWARFLQKNLRYPAVAREQGISGRVLLSFIVEKNGELTDIKVTRSAGFGFDEEAIRVLKLAKAWKPGIQNGKPVRVAYVIPLNFQLAEGE